MNCLSSAIPGSERVVSAEEVYELRVQHPDWVALQTRPPGHEGTGEIRLRRLIAEAQAETCREAQYTTMRAAIAAGMSAYRVAQLTGMTQRAVHRIRDREIGAAATRE